MLIKFHLSILSIDLPQPHIQRDVAHEKMKRVFSGHSASHAFFLNEHGDIYALGRNEHGQLGLPRVPKPAPASAIGSKSEDAVQIGGKNVYTATRLDRDVHFSPPLPADQEGDIVHVACGRNHSILCTRSGSVYAAGTNALGQCGNGQTEGDIEIFKRIEKAQFTKDKDAVVMVSAGITFSLILTASGKVYGIGSTEKGQLGNGKTGEHIIAANKVGYHTHTEPLLVRALLEKKIIKISSGQQHSIALDEDGYCYVWGFGGYGRLGLGTPPDDRLVPVLIPQFARENALMRAKDVFAGPTASAVIDRQRTFWLAGKWKTSGDGSAGQGFMTYKYFNELMGCKMRTASLGGVTLIAVADEDPSLRGDNDATMNIAWGQGAGNGELGLGFDKPKSATKPQRCEPLDGISIIDVAAGQNTTYYIARNLGDTYAELPSFPNASESQDNCLVCGKGDEAGEGEGDEQSGSDNVMLECERCDEPWHLQCLDPPLDSVPDGEWHCPQCLDLVLDRTKSTATNGSSKKRAAPDESKAGSKKKKAGK